MILTQQSEFHPLSVHTKPHVGSTEHPHLGLRSASPMVKLRSASSAARSFRATSPAKTTNEGKGHFISHPRGVGFVASLSKCNVGTLQKTGPKYCPALKKKKKIVSISLWRAKQMPKDFERSECLTWAPLPSSHGTAFAQIVVNIYSDHHKGAGEVRVRALSSHT